jgi:hypothetical protein
MLNKSMWLNKLRAHVSRGLMTAGVLLSVGAHAAESDPLVVVKAALAAVNSANGAPKVEDFLSSLPVDWRSNFTFVYGSASLQAASRTFPRAIAFAQDGQAVLTFNGHPDQFGYDQIELAIVRPNDWRLEYRDVTFCPEGTRAPCQAVLSDANPEKCAACHGRGPHYLWQPYKSWPGVYGSANDILTDGGAQEATDLLAFRGSIGENPRYRKLLFPAAPSNAFPYRMNAEAGFFLDRRSNTHLTMAMQRQHARILAGKIAVATTNMPGERTALIRRLAACPGFEGAGASAEIRSLATAIGLPFDDHWRLGLDAASSSDEGVLTYGDGVMRLPGALLAFLLPRLPEYASLLRGKGFGYADIFIYAPDLDVPTPRANALVASLDRMGLMFPSLGSFNALNAYVSDDRVPAGRKLQRAAVCAVPPRG